MAFAKDNKAYWKTRIQKRTYKKGGVVCETSGYYARTKWGEHRRWIPLGSGNKDIAARNAAEKYVILTKEGWKGLETKSSPVVQTLTVAEFLEQIEIVIKATASSMP